MLALNKAPVLKAIATAAFSKGNHQQVRWRNTQWFGVRHPKITIDETMVGPWPRTSEERERAAKKYNLIPEDYVPFDEDEGFGDYPNLKAIGAFNRDRYDDYDDPTDMRFYGEPFHQNADLYHWERVDPLSHEKRPQLSWTMRFIVFVFIASFIPAIDLLTRRYRIQINHNYKIRDKHPEQELYHYPPSVTEHYHAH